MIKLYLVKRLFQIVLLLCSLQSWAQTMIAGKVTDKAIGEGLPGVSILEKGTSNGTVTDANGNYSISVSENATLVFSFVGYTSQEIPVAGRASIDLVLEEDVRA